MLEILDSHDCGDEYNEVVSAEYIRVVPKDSERCFTMNLLNFKHQIRKN